MRPNSSQRKISNSSILSTCKSVLNVRTFMPKACLRNILDLKILHFDFQKVAQASFHPAGAILPAGDLAGLATQLPLRAELLAVHD